jgi:translation elongation factor EF-1alpha
MYRSNRTGEEMSLRGGMVICKGPPLPFKSFKFKATLLTMATLQPPIIPGSTFELYLHGEVVQCVITKLYSLNLTGDSATSGGGGKDKSTVLSKKLQKNVRSLGGQLGSVNGTKNRIENPKCIPGGRCAKVKIEVTESVCIEPFKICDALGRFALRSKGNTCAVGICEKVKKIT